MIALVVDFESDIIPGIFGDESDTNDILGYIAQLQALAGFGDDALETFGKVLLGSGDTINLSLIT